jgi:NIPSNAP
MRRKQCIFPLLLLLFVNHLATAAPKKDVYEIKVYRLGNDSQVTATDQYLKEALIPALHRAGIQSVGAFKPLSNDTSAVKLIYLFVPYESLSEWMHVKTALQADSSFARAARPYNESPVTALPFMRIESVLLEAFPDQPQFVKPAMTGDPAVRIYELRSYESPNISLSRKKINMFNQGGEIALFKKLEFNSVFYAEVLAGSRMPNLMYLTVYKDAASRNDHWKAFGESAEWKQISGDPVWEGKVSVSHIDSILMHRTEYSDL